MLFIVNPVCGKKTAKNYFISRVEPLLKTLEYDYKVIYTTRKDEATEICSKLREDNEEAFEGVVVLSGDGTLNEALKASVLLFNFWNCLSFSGVDLTKEITSFEKLS